MTRNEFISESVTGTIFQAETAVNSTQLNTPPSCSSCGSYVVINAEHVPDSRPDKNLPSSGMPCTVENLNYHQQQLQMSTVPVSTFHPHELPATSMNEPSDNHLVGEGSGKPVIPGAKTLLCTVGTSQYQMNESVSTGLCEWQRLMAALEAEKRRDLARHSMDPMERFLCYDPGEDPSIVLRIWEDMEV